MRDERTDIGGQIGDCQNTSYASPQNVTLSVYSLINMVDYGVCSLHYRVFLSRCFSNFH